MLLEKSWALWLPALGCVCFHPDAHQQITSSAWGCGI